MINKMLNYCFFYLEVGPNVDMEQCGNTGLGHRLVLVPKQGLGPGLGLGHGPELVLEKGREPGAIRTKFLLGMPFPSSNDGVLTATSLSTKPESNLCSGWSEEEEQLAGFGGGVGPGTEGRGECFEAEPAAGANCFSNQSGFWLMYWCMLQMQT